MRVRYDFSSKFTGKYRKMPTTNKHSVAFSKQAEEVIEKSDIILEVLDARFIDKTRNTELEAIAKKLGKKIIFILNKSDLVDVNELKQNYDLNSIEPYILFSIKNKVGRARLRKLISIEAKKVTFPKARVGVVGYPNTGKSSLINVLAVGKKAHTSPVAGMTRKIQEIKIGKNILILDSPGVIIHEEENSLLAPVVKKQTEIGVTDYNKVRYPDLVVNQIMIDNPGIFDEYYGVKSDGEAEKLLEILGKRWNFVTKGGMVDEDRTARKILKDWQEGKISAKIKASK